MSDSNLYKNLVLRIWKFLTGRVLEIGYGKFYLKNEIDEVFSSLLNKRYEKRWGAEDTHTEQRV